MDTLYIVRHGQAMDKQEDPERPLNQVGREQAEKLAAQLKEKGVSVAAAWHSGKKRAEQTAEFLAAATGPEPVQARFGAGGITPVKRDGLSPSDPVQPIADALEGQAGPLIIVGHLPFVAKLTGYLAGANDEPLGKFGECGCVCLEREPGERWRIAWEIGH